MAHRQDNKAGRGVGQDASWQRKTGNSYLGYLWQHSSEKCVCIRDLQRVMSLVVQLYWSAYFSGSLTTAMENPNCCSTQAFLAQNFHHTGYCSCWPEDHKLRATALNWYYFLPPPNYLSPDSVVKGLNLLSATWVTTLSYQLRGTWTQLCPGSFPYKWKQSITSLC